jgi:hypothetical protein
MGQATGATTTAANPAAGAGLTLLLLSGEWWFRYLLSLHFRAPAPAAAVVMVIPVRRHH